MSEQDADEERRLGLPDGWFARQHEREQNALLREQVAEQWQAFARAAAILAALREPSEAVVAQVAEAIEMAEPEDGPFAEQDLCLREAMEGLDWVTEEHIKALCLAAAHDALRAAVETAEREVRGG